MHKDFSTKTSPRAAVALPHLETWFTVLLRARHMKRIIKRRQRWLLTNVAINILHESAEFPLGKYWEWIVSVNNGRDQNDKNGGNISETKAIPGVSHNVIMASPQIPETQ